RLLLSFLTAASLTPIFLEFCSFLSRLPYLAAFFFFFTYPATTGFSTLSLHDALPISRAAASGLRRVPAGSLPTAIPRDRNAMYRSEEHTSELQSPDHLVCRLLLEKKKKTTKYDKEIRKNTTNQS